MSLGTNTESSEHSCTSPTDANFFHMEKDFFTFMGCVDCLLAGKHSTEGSFLIEKILMWEILIIVKIALQQLSIFLRKTP